MEQLRQLARDSFDASAARFKPNAATQLRLLQLALAGDTAVAPRDDVVSEARLLELLDANEPTSPGTASLRLVVVPRAEDDAIDMSHDGFRRLMDRFDMDPLVLQHVTNNSYGFHAHDGQHCYYVGTYVYSLAWYANPATSRTNAVLLLRTAPVLQNGDFIRESFPQILRQFSPHLYAPHFVLFVVYVHLCTTSKVAVDLNIKDLRRVETLTRHGPGQGASIPDGKAAVTSKSGAQAINIDELSNEAQNIAVVQVHLANLLRHVPYIKDIAAYLRNAGPQDRCLNAVVPEQRDRSRRALGELLDMLDPLEKMTCDLEPTVKYLQTRANGQSSVITSLMTHLDASLNTEIAAAAHRDSSAMRSIAMMTMIFLPATFFAALFSMPCIPNWAQTNFWVYWVCAGPSTAIVLGVFYVHRSLKKAKQRGNDAKGHSVLREGLLKRRRGAAPVASSTGVEKDPTKTSDISVVERGLPR